ncbi:MAG TPA: bifunctional (p)ppGpp synthetase/guanosine-3',5'-bis(diphosphate) 3'-pyrophosphohydrolase [Burkholderiales bacterium]|nr:bifunctional (p)ppGpp synthetase/guanosine-3',5'-bis(diphosphate) 3'-pyrophosphohydrolase [Burkholderiales bacterium]
MRLVSDRAPALEAWLVAASASFSDAERAVVASALDLAAAALHGVIRRSGEPALTHALGTADVLLALRLDHEAVSAALLSPVLATASAAAAKIREQFGNTIASLAEGAGRMDEIGALTARQLPGKKPEQQAAQLEALRKMLLAMVEDVRVVLIKLADHTHELRYVIRCDDQSLRREVAELARDIFAPLANRLGIWQVKWELEDLALRALEPDAYKRIARLIDEKRADRERYIEAVVALLKGELRRSGIVAEVAGRPKHIFSIYKKMSRKDTDYEYIYDVRAVRILVDSVRDCYAALGLVHQLWSPIPKEFDDYIARPKANQYRSLHTAVIGPEGKAIEVQIRTHEMHQHSELGVAAHWRYKEGARRDHGYDEKIAWLRQILDWREDVGGAGELVEQFRTGVFDDVVYVLTPQGKVIALPKGATPVDFAYHVHTELGHRCRGARVDGVMVPLNTPLANGQRVEIHAAKQGGPSRDWLNPQLGYLQSAGARTKVRQWFNRQNHETAVVQGRALLEKELQRRGMTALGFERVAAAAGYARLDEFLADLGSGKVGPKQLALALDPAPEAEAPSTEEALVTRRARASARDAVLVVGVDKLLTAPARCCKPVPPDPIIGFVTRGRGVSVHRAKCVNVKRLDARRCVPAEWGQAAGVTFPVEIEIEAIDRTGLLRDISDVLSRERINVTATHSLSSQLAARMRFTLEVTDAGQLKRVLALIREVRGVIAAARR